MENGQVFIDETKKARSILEQHSIKTSMMDSNGNSVPGTFVPDHPDVKLHIDKQTVEQEQKKLDKITKSKARAEKKRYLAGNREPVFSICFMDSLSNLTSRLTLNRCGRMIQLLICMTKDSDNLLKTEDRAMKLDDIAGVWGMTNNKEAGRIINELMTEGFLIKQGTRNFKISDQYATMGSENLRPFVKLYHTKTEELGKRTSAETLGLLCTLIPLVNLKNGSICNNPYEKVRAKIDYLTLERLIVKLNMSRPTLMKHLDALAKNGAILPMPSEREIHFKMHPDFVSRMNVFAAKAIKSFISDNLAVAQQARERRRKKKEEKGVQNISGDPFDILIL